MADILSAISNTASSLRNIGQQALGKAGKAVDIVGTALGNPFPQITAFGPQGLSGALESYGAQALTPQQQVAKVAVDPRFQPENAAKTGNPVVYNVPNQPSSPASTQYKSQQDVPAGDKGWAQQYLKDSNSGKVVWDDNLRAKANSILNPPSNNPPEVKRLSGEDINKMIGDLGANGLIDQKALESIYNKYGGAADRAAEISREIEDTARANAEDEYRQVKEALGVQKGEIQTIAGQQQERIKKEKEFGVEELGARKEKEVKTIGEQSKAFGEEVASQKDQLAKNWRDLSLEVQRVMRARGVSESSYASDKETALLLDFNKGLRTLAKSSTKALKDFSDAIVETNSFYTREQGKLEYNATNANQDVDNWVRQSVQSIQAQEGVALNKKLADIRNAILQGNQLKIQTAQKIEDQKAALETWLLQTQIQYKNAVALAAQGKVNDAASGIKTTWDAVKFANDVLTQGGGAIETNPSTGNPAIHGKVFNTKTNTFDEFWYPVTSGFAKAYETNQAYKAAQAQNAGLLNPVTPTAVAAANPLTQSPWQALLGAIKK